MPAQPPNSPTPASIELVEVTTKTLTPSMLDAIATINADAVPAVGEATPDHLRFLIDESLITLTAIDTRETSAATSNTPAAATAEAPVAGFCIVLPPGSSYGSENYRWFSARSETFFYLDRVAISPAYHRLGIGRRMYAEVERLAAARRERWASGASGGEFCLEVNLEPRNDQSLAFHADLGFAEVGQQATSYGAVVSMMSKPFTS